MSDTLYAFYDLAVNPNSFDVSKFLVLADLERRTIGSAAMHIVVVPDDKGWARSDDLHAPDQQEWRLRNLLIPTFSLMPSIQGYTVCHSREHAVAIEAHLDGPVFPEGHTTAKPVARFEWADLVIVADRGLPSMSAAPQARAYAKNWIDSHAGGRKVISLTMREMDQQPHRNNDHDAWLAFAARLDPERYCPVVIRDTHFALDAPHGAYRDVLLFPEAAFNLEIRAGFYEQCYLNLFVNNGPAEVSLLNTRIAYLFFMKIRTPGSDGISQEVPDYGIPRRGEHPVHGPHQHTVWDGDSLPVLEREFAAMERRLEEQADEIEAFRRREVFPASTFGGTPLCQLLAFGRKWRQADALADRLAAEGQIPLAQVEYLKGSARLNTHLLNEAIEHLTRAIQLDDSKFEHHFQLANVLVGCGRPDESEPYFRRAVQMAPNAPQIELAFAMVLIFQGKLEEGEEIVMRQRAAGVRHPHLLRAEAAILRQRGRLKEAAELELQAARAGARASLPISF